MIRDILVAVVFFFGPMLLMFVLRNMGALIRLWIAIRRQRRKKPNIIDISPKSARSPSLGFVAVAIFVGALSAYWAWHYTRQEPSGIRDMQYEPAHLDAHGQLVQGKFVPIKQKNPDRVSTHPTNDRTSLSN